MNNPPTRWPVTLDLDVLWGDLDALGHVNNTRFFVWFESVRIATFAAIGITASPSSVGPILASTTCNFRAPVGFPAALTAGCNIERVGNTSFVMHYGLWHRGSPDTLLADGSGVVVMVDYAKGAKVPISDEIRAAIAALADR